MAVRGAAYPSVRLIARFHAWTEDFPLGRANSSYPKMSLKMRA